MPLGSSSAAPVTRPGLRLARNPGVGEAFVVAAEPGGRDGIGVSVIVKSFQNKPWNGSGSRRADRFWCRGNVPWLDADQLLDCFDLAIDEQHVRDRYQLIAQALTG